MKTSFEIEFPKVQGSQQSIFRTVRGPGTKTSMSTLDRRLGDNVQSTNRSTYYTGRTLCESQKSQQRHQEKKLQLSSIKYKYFMAKKPSQMSSYDPVTKSALSS